MANVQSRRIIPTPSSYAREHFFYVQEIGTLTSKSPHISTRNNIFSYLFLVVVKGSGSFSYQGKTFTIHAGDCVFVDCHEPYSHESSANDPWTLTWVHFYGTHFCDFYHYYTELGFPFCFHPSDLSGILNTLSCLYQVHEEKNALTEILSNKYLTDLVTAAFLENRQEEESGSIRKKLELIREYLMSHYNEKISLDQLSAVFFISKYHLSREYKRYFGVTLMNDLNSMRLSKAKSLLRFSDESVERIAEQCGFGDSAYFIRVFKAAENLTPYSYRRKW